MTLKLTYAGFNYVADIDGSYAMADSLAAMQGQTASNSVALTDDYGINASTSTVYADYSGADTTGNTETIANLTATIQEAEAKGLSVIVRPLIDFTYDASPATLQSPDGTQYQDGDWRAYYKPADISAFFNSYDTMLVNEARAAQAGGAQLFDIGTEVDQLTGPAYLSYWTKIIQDVRAVYSGKLTYSAISDDDLSPWQYGGGQPAAGTGNLTTQVSFWSQLDYVGIDEYAAITAQPAAGSPDPTLQQLIDGWEKTPTDPATDAMTGGKSLIQYYEDVSAATGKPLLFTEIGYNSAPDAAYQPFYTSSNTYDPTLQANLYKAFFQAWKDQGNAALQGVYIWDWEPDPGTVGAGTDPSWTPQGNTGAVQVVQTAYSAAVTASGGPNDAYVWNSTSGDWDLPQLWIDLATNAPYQIPGSTNPVVINGDSMTADVITDEQLGIGNSASLSVTRLVTLNGNFNTGVLTVGTAAQDATLMDGGALTAASGTVVNGTLGAGGGATLTVTGTLTLGGAAATADADYQTLTSTGGSLIRLGGLMLGATDGFYVNNYVFVDGGSTIEIGTRGSATAGALTIDPGSMLSGPGTIAANLYNFGSLSVQGGSLYVEGFMNGAGTTQIGTAATLDVQAMIGTVTFAGPEGTLVLHPGSAASMGQAVQLAVLGFASGDTIDLAGMAATSLSYQQSLGYGTLTVYNGASVIATFAIDGTYAASRFTLHTDAAGTGHAIGLSQAASDFNDDGKSDLLLQNTDGTLMIETQSNLGVTSAVSLGNPGADWHAVGTADLNGDGNADILVQNTNGQIVDYLLNGTAILSGNYLPYPGAGWSVRGTGDFAGTGQLSILLQNQNSGNMVLWATDGTAVTSATFLGSPGANWTVEGLGDFNGDGTTDILVQNTVGQLVDYVMNNNAITAAHYLGYPGPGWSVAGTGDYSGDGRADLLLHNDNGANVVWNTDGATITGQSVLDTPSSDYAVASAAADLNGDGNTDLLVQSRSTGALVGYTVSDTATITAGAVLDTPGSSWHLITNNPVEIIDGTGSALNLAATPGLDQFVLTSVAAGLHTIAGIDPAQDTIALNAAAFPSYANVQANEQPYMGGTYLNLSPNNSAGLWIKDVGPGQLTSANFILQ